jgi:hypothetical protein
MVRLLKVKELEERKRFLLASSEMYRQTLTLEVANIKFSTALLKRRLKSPKHLLMLLGLAVPVAGYVMGRRAKATEKSRASGWLPKLVAGWKLYQRVAPLIKKFRPTAKNGDTRRQNMTQYP